MTLIGYWPLHDDSAQDYSGNGNHGSMNGSPTTGVAGRGGLEATSFDGTDDYIDTNNGGSFGNPDYTMLVWVRPRTQQYTRLITNYDGGGHDNETAIRLDQNGNGHVSAHLSNGSSQWSVEGTTNVFDNAWHLVGAVRRGDTLEVWADGEMENSVSVSGTVSKSTDHWLGQSSGDSAGYDGAAFDLRFYNRALTSAEIQTLYEMGSADLARPPTDGVARYPLDGDATDSWNGNDATNNGATFTSNAIRSQAASFDGSSNIQTPISDTYSTFTWSYWVNPDNSGVNSEAYVSTRSSASGAGSRQRNGNLDFYAYDSDNGSFTEVDSGVTVTAGEWYHVVGVVSSSGIQVYVNGTLKSAKSFGTYGNGPEVWLGEQPGGGNNAQADIDDVRIYDYALTPQEVHELYQWGTRGKDMRKHLVNKRQ